MTKKLTKAQQKLLTHFAAGGTAYGSYWDKTVSLADNGIPPEAWPAPRVKMSTLRALLDARLVVRQDRPNWDLDCWAVARDDDGNAQTLDLIDPEGNCPR